MKILKNKKNGFTVTLEIETDFVDVENATGRAYVELAKDAKVPGFRQGKVPRNVFEKHYGKEILLDRASSIVMNDCYKQALTDEKLEPVDFPKNVEVKTFEASKPFVFSLSVDVVPEVKLHKYKGLKAEEASAVVTEEEIQKQIDQLRSHYMEYKDSADPVKKDDMVNYASKAFDGETPVEEWTKEKAVLRVGSAYIAEAFDQEVLGMKKGESKTFSVKIKDDYYLKKVAGKEIKFEILITEVKSSVLPEMNDEFAKKVSNKETVADLKADIKEHLTKTKQQEVDQKLRQDLLTELVKENDLEVPEAMVKEKANNMLKNLESRLQQMKISVEQYLQITGSSVEKIQEQYQTEAVNRVKEELLLKAIAEKEELAPTDEEFDKELEKIFKENNQKSDAEFKLEETKKNLPPQIKDYITNYLREEKAFEFLKNNAKIK